jgi:hypothetical protein
MDIDLVKIITQAFEEALDEQAQELLENAKQMRPLTVDFTSEATTMASNIIDSTAIVLDDPAPEGATNETALVWVRETFQRRLNEPAKIDDR